MNIKFLTINIWFGGKEWDNLISFIHQERPDILCLQEVYDGHNQSLDKRFRTMEEFKKEFVDFLPYSAYGATIIDTGHDNTPWGNAVFSKFTIKNFRTIFFDLPLARYDFKVDPDSRLAAEGMLETEVVINEKTVYVYSWHGVWNNHGGDTPQREIMGKVIIESLENKKNIILAGDTNMDPASTVIQYMQKELDLKSVFSESLQTTFNMKQKKHPGNFANSPVDMIFISPDLRILSKEMPISNVSDHYPLKAELEI